MSDVLLLSGGIDSISLAAWLRPALCITVDYGQLPAKTEIEAAAQVCAELQMKHLVLQTDIRNLGTGDLAGQHNPHSQHSEFWPFRNQFLVTVAAMSAMRYGHDRVLIGTVVSDKRHTDGSAAFIRQLSQLMELQEGAIRLEAPAVRMTSMELIEASKIPLSTLCWAHSCHTAALSCGRCAGCEKHSGIMSNLGLHR